MNLKYNHIFKKKISKINLIKIVLILFSSLYLIANFEPYYENIDPYVYGLSGIEISKGSYEITNGLLESSGRWEFVPHQWIKTVHETAIPKSSPGLPFLAGLAFIIANDYGLFYFGPIFSIAVLIASERIATKLFNDKIGFLTLLLLSTNFMLTTIGNRLLTEPVFTLMIIFGFYYFVKFIKNNQSHYILLSSLFFVIASLFRIVGTVFLSFEFLLFVGYLFYYSNQNYNEGKFLNSKLFHNFFRLVTTKKTLIFFLFLIIPWIAFFIFTYNYNDYFFGNPFITYGNLIPISTNLSELNNTEIFNFDYDSFSKEERGSFTESFDNSRSFSNRLLLLNDRYVTSLGYFLYLLPSQFPWAQTLLESYEDEFGKYFLGIIPQVILIPVLIFSIKMRSKRAEIITLIFGILALVGIYSFTSLPTDVVGRYMYPAIPFFSILLAFMIIKIFEIIPKISPTTPIFSKGIKNGFLFFLIIYFSFTLVISNQVQWLLPENFTIKNPEDYSKNYPLDKEGLTDQSILVNYYGAEAVEFGLIPFNGYLGNPVNEYSPDNFSKGSIGLLKIAMSKGFNAYVLKEPRGAHEIEYFTILLQQHDIVLKDFSKSFCKFEIGNNSSGKIVPFPDEICYKKVEPTRKKMWYDNILN